MLDNNLILLLAIGIVVFLIYRLNDSKKNVHHEGFEDSTSSPSSPTSNQVGPSSAAVQTILTSSLPVMSTQPTQPSTPTIDSLSSLYSSNLKGTPTDFTSNSTATSFTADYGQGYSLGVDTNDPRLSKFTSQAPPQKVPLISDDLLPKKSEDWFETPNVGTKIDDANLLADAIFKVGVDTVGSTRKNPSYDLRGNIPNPKFAVSPWNNSSYEPDNNLKSWCI
jgi:hypothetical protein